MTNLSKAITYLRQGDLALIGYGITKQVSEKLGGVRVVAEMRPPQYLSSGTDMPEMERDPEDGSSYRTVLNNVEELSVEPDEEFDVLEFSLHNVRPYRMVTVSVEGYLGDETVGKQ